jgi:tRNA A37 methylthiotransferase MiaB
MRIRFTSPHPKDFPDEVLYLIRDRPNICRQLHLPAQSGSTRVLAAMRRGYTTDVYLELVDRVRRIIPGVALSSDFIAGFCGETEQDHEATVALMRCVKYHFAFCFPYSMRQKTHASHRLVDDVSPQDKARRHEQLIGVFREEAELLNSALIGQRQLVLIEGTSKRSSEALVGRSESNVKVIIPRQAIPSCESGAKREGVATQGAGQDLQLKAICPGDYVTVQITDATSQVMKGKALHHTTLQGYYKNE